MKTCSKCKVEKPFSEFYKNNRYKDGHAYSCKNCCKNYGNKRYRKIVEATGKTVSPKAIKKTGMKHCYKCKTYKPMSNFHKNKSKHDGLHSQCKDCKAARVQRTFIGPKWPKECIECGKKSHAKGLCHSHYKSRYRRDYMRYREAMREKRIRNNPTSPTNMLERDLIKDAYPVCVACGHDGELFVDHIWPAAWQGINGYANYQMLCRPCNSSKGASYKDYRPLEKRMPQSHMITVLNIKLLEKIDLIGTGRIDTNKRKASNVQEPN